MITDVPEATTLFAIAYSTTNIILMLAVIVIMQMAVGKAVTHRQAEK